MTAALSSRQFLFMSLNLFFLLIIIFAPRATSLSFSFNFSSSGDPCEDGRLRCERDTHIDSGVLELTKNDIFNTADVFSFGRASYMLPVPLWDRTSGELASFTSKFTFQIRPINETYYRRCNVSGDGMAFFLGHYPSRIPPNSYGSNLGLFNDSNRFNATGGDRIVAVEFDTNRQDWDPSDNHVGIDVNSIDSKAYTNVTGNIVSDDAIMTAKISYDNITGVLAAQLIDDGKRYNVSQHVDMKASMPEEVAVGFSAATGACIELHQVLSWSFSSTLEAARSKATTGRRRRLVPILVPSAVAFLVLICVAVGCLRRYRYHGATDGDSDGEREQGEFIFERGVGLRRYRYHELATDTGNFAEEEKLGHGGFGNVYRGSLGDDDHLVAVKMFSAESSAKARKAFEAEANIISRLRHRNLVQLLGWCDSREGLLLVYELVPEGSLDRHLYSSSLTWSQRYKIVLGLGSALRYLHTEWDQCVLHGDIKPSNILLDSSHSTKLGDFGLARLIDHGAGPRTTQVVMGTAGYIDPEFIRTRRPSTESDVYSFGVVLLEIVTGRRPVMEHPDKVIPLLRWVWDIYDRDALLEAVDERLTCERLHDDCDEELQLRRVLVVGLWCAHPDPGARPSIVQAMNVLQSEDAKLPALSRQTSDFSRGQGLPAADSTSCADMSCALSGGR
ncbi:hypothetical protein ACP70R_046418 [Stipagrostis hirtigluma subsp. patula]